MMSSLNLHEVCHSATPTDVTKHVIEILLVEATRPLRRRSIDRRRMLLGQIYRSTRRLREGLSPTVFCALVSSCECRLSTSPQRL